MKARGLALALAGTVGILALALLMIPTAAAAPAASPATTPACSVHVQLIVPPYAHLHQIFVVHTLVVVSGTMAGCSTYGIGYTYLGFPAGVPPSLASFPYSVNMPGAYHVAVLVHGSFGTVPAFATLAVGE